MISAKKLDSKLDIQRRVDRRTAYLEECFIQSDSRSLWVRSINLSEGGMCIAVKEYGVLKRGTNIAVFIRNFPPIDAQVRWTRGNIAGVKFLTSVENHTEILGLLKRLHDGTEAGPSPTANSVDEKLPTNLSEVFTQDIQQVESTLEARAYSRLNYIEKCHIKTDKKTFKAESQDISEGGMCLKLLGLGKVDLGDDIEVILPCGYPPIKASLRWMKDRKIGVEFHTPIKDHPIFFDIDKGLDKSN